MEPLRFLQLSDVHFGARLTGGRLGLDADTARARRADRRAAFARAFEHVRERGLDGVLIPGDLFDGESIDTDTLRFVMHTMESIAPRPVFVAPGNHDAYGGASPYRTVQDEDVRGLRWPANVHVFAHADFRAVPWPGRDDVHVVGSGVATNQPAPERRLRERIARPEGRSILLFHGSRDDGGFLQAHKSTHPFSRDELLAQGFDWVALGHYHARDVILDDEGLPRAAYGGCLVAGGLDERSPRGALEIELDDDRTNVTPVELDARDVVVVEVDLSGADFADAVASRIEQGLREVGARDQDMVLVRATGRRARGLDLDALSFDGSRFFHFRFDVSGLRPDVDLDAFPSVEDARTTDELFVARLRDQPPADVPAERVRRALLYGLDALEHGRLDLRYEE